MLNEFIGWMQEPGKWNDGVVLCGIAAVGILVYLIKQDGKDFWKNF